MYVIVWNTLMKYLTLNLYEILQIPDSVCQVSLNRHLLDDVGKAWGRKDLNHTQMAGIPKESTEVSPYMPRTHHRERVASGSTKV